MCVTLFRGNYTPYEGDASFLKGPTTRTEALWTIVKDLLAKEIAAGGVLDAETKIVSTVDAHGPGFIRKELESIVGLQTDAPLKRGMLPYGGVRSPRRPLRPTGAKWIRIQRKFFAKPPQDPQ